MTKEEKLIEENRIEFTRKLLFTLLDLHERLFLKQVELRKRNDNITKFLLSVLPEIKKNTHTIGKMHILNNIIQTIHLIGEAEKTFIIHGELKIFNEIYRKWEEENKDFLHEVNLMENIKAIKIKHFNNENTRNYE
jgi:hypothetical protein